MDAFELAVAEFCYGGGRAVPRSVFLGRAASVGGCNPCRWGWPRSMCVCEPLWLPEDTKAALEYHAYLKSLCPGGCGRPRVESMDIAMDDHYDVFPIACNACRARDFKAWNRNAGREPGDPPLFGEFYAVTPEGPDTHQAAVVDDGPRSPVESERVGADV